MRSISFVAAHGLVLVGAGWLLLRMLLHTDPQVPLNVAVVLLLLFFASGSVASLLSWATVRRLRAEARYGMALRHGAWAGLFVVVLPLLRWMDALSWLVVGAVLLVIGGLESLILLQQEPAQEEAE